MAPSGEITQLLQRLQSDSEEEREQLLPLIYDELRRIARSRMRNERAEHTLSPTALVHEAYLRLFNERSPELEDRRALYAAASETMRRVLIDYARSRKRLKRGGREPSVPLEEAKAFLTVQQADEVLALESALVRLGELDEKALEVVHHRFFAGLTMEEIGELQGVSAKTVQRTWVAARAWLRKEVAAQH